MKTTKRMEKDVAVISLSGKLMGGPDAESVRQIVRETLEEGARKIVIDISGVSWVNSTGLGILIAGHVTAANAGARLKLTGVSARIRQIFMVTKLHTVFDTCESVEEALESFSS
ncbi:MAG: STAS domain-containing protein [Candidatus Eisenbacteria bacterium]|uniref:Anti-sigma factor antagonist n=1 Tax=Eiseniibacteriota bacterium TaxID=2212470 RepID=A0A937XBN5_UNCEI|nr:STAS domain-containing protein [Candidatus Eisenbacteria bacterium]